jgi:hypothetical protein
VQPSYQPETAALIARMTVPPSTARANAIDALILSLKTAGIWSLLDALYVMAAHTEQAGRLNWVSAAYTLAPNGQPVFGADVGYKFDSISQWADTGLNPSLGAKFQQNSAMMAAYILESSGYGGNVAGLYNGTNGTQIVPRNSSDKMQYRINQAAATVPTTAISQAGGAGLYAVNRSDSANVQAYIKGALFNSATPTSTALVNGTFGFGKLGSTHFGVGGSTVQFGAVGASLTAAQHAQLNAAIEAYRSALRVYPIQADFSVVAQTYKGGYIELQPDSFNGGSTTPATDSTTDLWGFPYSLTSPEQTRLRGMVMPGGGKGIMYLRFPLGFAYRGYRNIDSTTGLAKNIGERFAGQSVAVSALITNVIPAGGGLQPEYWCPAPYWMVNSSYAGSNTNLNTLWAGGSYARTVTLDSIRASDATQYNAQIAAFTDAVLNDLEYLHTNVGPVRMYSLQNEPNVSNAAYGSCGYSDTLYSDVLTILEPKVRASPVLATYGGAANTPLLNVGSADGLYGAAFSNANPTRIFGYTYHSIVPIYKDADCVKVVTTQQRGARPNWWINECEYFDTGAGPQFQCANNMLRDCHNLVYGNAPVLMPIIHMVKQLGQSGSTSSTAGFGLMKTRLPAPFSQAPTTAGDSDPSIGHGEFAPVLENYNSFLFVSDNVPIGSVRVGGIPALPGGVGFAAFTNSGKLICLLVNRTSSPVTLSVPMTAIKTFSGKRYDYLSAGAAVGSQSGITLTVTIPAMSGEAWTEQ